VAFDIAQKIEQDLDPAPIAFGRLIDDLLDDRPALGDFPAPAIFGDDDGFVQRFFERRVFTFLAPGGRPFGLPDWPLTKRV
jgi:hypothetical protein